MANYTFLDAYSSIQTAESSIVSGVVQRPIVAIGSIPSVVAVISSSIFAVQSGQVISSIIGAYAEDSGHIDGNIGIFNLAVRNDAVSSFSGTNTDYTPFGVDSAGRGLIKPFAAEEAVLRGHGSVNGVASIQLLAAGGTGLKTYLTDVTVANTGAAATLVTFTDGDASVIGRTIAPAGGGSNIIGLDVPLVTMKTNTPINMVAATATSVLYGYATGFKAP